MVSGKIPSCKISPGSAGKKSPGSHLIQIDGADVAIFGGRESDLLQYKYINRSSSSLIKSDKWLFRSALGKGSTKWTGQSQRRQSLTKSKKVPETSRASRMRAQGSTC